MTTLQELNLAFQHHGAGRLEEAERICRQILCREPGHADTLLMLGVIAWQTRRHDVAVNLFRQSIAYKPNYPEAWYNLANALRDQGQRDEAIAAFGKAIEQKPCFFNAHVNLGALLADMGRLDEAIIAQRRALAIEPNAPNAHYNLGTSLQRTGELDAAIAAFRQAIAIDPQLRAAHGNLSIAQCHCDLADALMRKGLLNEAIVGYRQAISLDAKWTTAYRGLAHALEVQGNIPEAVTVLETAMLQGLDSAACGFELAAMGVGETPPSTPPQSLIGLFNEYARNFDQHLQQLRYVGPQLLFDAVGAAHPPAPMDIIDLGCGTGLCGQLFRPMARHLSGIDLAPRMIDKARQRGVYDQLEEKDIAAALAQRPQGVDLILAADVFIYIGSLDPVFEAAATALRPDGLFAFTIESLDAGDYVLRRSRRYAQSIDYIRRLASRFGFSEVSIRDAVVRTENNAPIAANVVVLKHP